MRRNVPTLTSRLAAAMLLLLVQVLALGHAAAEGEQPHEHYGVTCELQAVAAEVAPLPLSPELPAPPRTAPLAEKPATDFRPWSRPPGRAPPPRSPPAFFQ